MASSQKSPAPADSSPDSPSGPVPLKGPLRQRAAVLNLPNLITGARLVLAIVLFVMIDCRANWLASTIVFIVAAGTDAVDGYIARRYGLVTVLGRILDPLVDKIIVCGAFVFLLPLPGSGVNAWMVITILGRELLVTSLRSLLEEQGQDFSATMSGKIKMVLQCIAIGVTLVSIGPEFKVESDMARGFLMLRDVLLWTAVAATVYSGYVYVVRAIDLFRNPPAEG